jgi:glucosamine--fructose-6-phosphate aminotransferase (isomerizing)
MKVRRLPTMMQQKMIKEINETVPVLERLDQEGRADVERVARKFQQIDPSLVVESSRGSSLHASIYGQYLFGSLLGIPVARALGSLYTDHGQVPKLQNAFVVAMSSRGETEDVCAAARQTVKDGVPTVGISNNAKSTLSGIVGADNFIRMCAGAPEESYAFTKTMTSSMTILLMLVHAIRGERFDIKLVIDAFNNVLAHEEEIARLAGRFQYTRDFVMLGTGYNYGTALEAALKVKETCLLHAEGTSSVEVLHGPISILNREIPVILFAPSDPSLKHNIELVASIKAKQAQVLIVSNDDQALGLGDFAFRLPSVDPTIAPIAGVMFAQLFAYHLSQARKIDTNDPQFYQHGCEEYPVTKSLGIHHVHRR